MISLSPNNITRSFLGLRCALAGSRGGGDCKLLADIVVLIGE